MKLTKEVITEISNIKNEPKWMLEFRLKALDVFNNIEMPKFGPSLDINFDDITYYRSLGEKVYNSWEEVPEEAKETFDKLGLKQIEQEYLAGLTSQYDSSPIYHNMIKELTDKNIVFCDTDTALKEHPELFKKYFNNLVKVNENKFTALNAAVWSGGSFIYIPPHTKLDRPLQSYFRINTRNLGQFERTIIIVDDNSELDYIEGCTAPNYTTDSLHAGVVEIYIGKNAKCTYTTIQNWSDNVYNLVTKRAILEDNASMEWIDGNIGSKVTMKYPACILKGDNSKANCISIALAKEGQIQDTGAKMIHLGQYTSSNVLAKSICAGGSANYRGKTFIDKNASHSKSSIKCDTIMIDDNVITDSYPDNICNNSTSVIEHEATVSKVKEEALYYLALKGIDEEIARSLIVLGFTNSFKSKLPVEYAVELQNLLKLNFNR